MRAFAVARNWYLKVIADSMKWLFKPPTEKNGFRQGEDWSEKVRSEIARLISVPCAEIQLAVRSGRPGSISRNLRPQGWEMQSGSLLLAEAMPSSVPRVALGAHRGVKSPHRGGAGEDLAPGRHWRRIHHATALQARPRGVPANTTARLMADERPGRA